MLAIEALQCGYHGRRVIGDLSFSLRGGDLLVVNNSRVFPARLLGVRDPSGGAAECFLLRRLDADPSSHEEWSALVHPGQKLKPGARIVSHRFDMGDWKPEQERIVRGSHVMLWTIAAR